MLINHVTRMDKSLSNTRMSHCHTYAWVTSHIRMSCITHLQNPVPHLHESWRRGVMTWLMHICVTWLNHMCDMTQSHMWHDSIVNRGEERKWVVKTHGMQSFVSPLQMKTHGMPSFVTYERRPIWMPNENPYEFRMKTHMNEIIRKPRTNEDPLHATIRTDETPWDSRPTKEDPWDTIIRKSLSANAPRIIWLFCRKWPRRNYESWVEEMQGDEGPIACIISWYSVAKMHRMP